MWGEFPHTITLSTDGLYLNNDIDDYLNDDSDEYNNDKNPHFCNFEHIYVQNTLNNIINSYKNVIVYRNGDYPVIIGNHMIVSMQITEDSTDVYILQNEEYLTDKFIGCIADIDDDDEANYTYLWESEGSFDEVTLAVKTEDIENVNIDKNYNDDLPHKEITDFLKSSESGIILLHGYSGTGKSAYIKYLINEIMGRHFIVMNANTLQSLSANTLAQIYLGNKDNVMIIEDNASSKNNINKIEQIKTLISVENSFGSKVPYKAIFVFNDAAYNYSKDKMQSNKIKVDYEFKYLNSEKAVSLCMDNDKEYDASKSYVLSDIIGGDNVDEYEQTVNKHKIGF